EKATAGAKISLHDLPSIQANRKQMIQLFHHLIDNSIKFRKDESPQISIRAEKRGSYYLFSVEDNGIGMEEAYQDKIFGLFLRLHTKKSKYKGTGIGLSICKKIVEQHKGKIWIDSKLGDGTTVYFTLPKDPNSISSEEKIPAKYRKWEKVTLN
ncbi:MAG: ATP-binding protein, partial [Bacteroidota bacterium]